MNRGELLTLLKQAKFNKGDDGDVVSVTVPVHVWNELYDITRNEVDFGLNGEHCECCHYSPDYVPSISELLGME